MQGNRNHRYPQDQNSAEKPFPVSTAEAARQIVARDSGAEEIGRRM